MINTVSASIRVGVPYYRVSTTKQGQSGLGLEAQQSAVDLYASLYGVKLAGEFIEIETSTKTNRPVLQEALAYCAEHNAYLIIAKLDRLGRNVAFIAALMESDIEFVAVDYPNASRFMLHLLAAFAEHERHVISTRTKEALQAAKRRGVKLGTNGKKLSITNKKKRKLLYKRLRPVIKQLAKEGVTTLRGIAQELNLRKVPSFRRGGRWHSASVYKLLRTLKERRHL